MGSSSYENVNKLLEYYDKCQKQVNSYKPVIKRFLETLRSSYNSKQNLTIKVKHFYRVGSSYEDTVVHPKADFDIGMVLSYPYNLDCFVVLETENPGIYKLQCASGSSYFPNLLTCNNFLKVENLRRKVSEDLISVLKSMNHFEGYKIIAQEGHSGVDVQLRKPCHATLKLDIIPQMEGKVSEDLPDFKGELLNSFLKDIIESEVFGVFFTLACPPSFKNEKFSYLLAQANFTLLEANAVQSISRTVYDAIRISKGLLYCHKTLMGGGLRSFQIKRIAFQFIEEIDRTNDSWEGCKLLMKKFIDMLFSGGVEGYIIQDQQILWKGEKKCEELGKTLEKIVQDINPRNVRQELVTDWEMYNADE